VVDIANDPLSTPHVYLCCDPVRPYVSAALPHGVRRFEFMVMPGETEAELSKPENLRKLLGKVLPNPDNIELIRSRVYTHNARLAGRFRQGGCCWPAMPRTSCRCGKARVTTAACAMRPTWRGSWRW
jgi:3-(3-hydroxy-phenyl)propionate hydroxylase